MIDDDIYDGRRSFYLEVCLLGLQHFKGHFREGFVDDLGSRLWISVDIIHYLLQHLRSLRSPEVLKVMRSGCAIKLVTALMFVLTKFCLTCSRDPEHDLGRKGRIW